MTGKTFDEAVAGDEWEAKFTFSPEVVQWYAGAVEDSHPWYMYAMEDSPFGGRIIHPTLCHICKIVARSKGFPGEIFWPDPPPVHRLHVKYDAEYYRPAKVGETVTIKAKVSSIYVRRGRKYIETEYFIYGEDGQKVARYLDREAFGFRGTESQV